MCCTHINSDPRELEDCDLLVLVAWDEAEELMAILDPRMSVIIRLPDYLIRLLKFF